MAQLPPKAPTMTHHNWPNTFPNYHHMMPPSSASAQPPYWVDEFLDFSSSRRNSHRRSVSDPIAFAEVQFGEDCNNNNNNNSNIGFDRLDDEQLCNMFSDEVPPTVTSTSNPSTSSDHNSENEQEKTMLTPQMPKKEPGEVDSECEPEMKPGQTFSAGKDDSDTIIVDPKRVKRILANRQSAQRSRVRKLQYISELERSVTSLQTEVSALSPRVAFLDHQRLILNVDNSALKQRIAALAQDKLFKDAHQEALKKEIERLRRVYHDQSLKKMDHNATAAPPAEEAAAATNDHEQQQQ
ncbi:Basic leucine zipper 61 [Heracleum sosnowskyi]|uniref:Basic leucine zipper 61 n=1 Tax=Heracleum sosnowskyi TaxID=360622 RepID=A0AAD8MY48_9APIA|nr:Basic leucine zipper 61 [Heracleum sosnowskyi]